jgi:hypothetical protein
MMPEFRTFVAAAALVVGAIGVLGGSDPGRSESNVMAQFAVLDPQSQPLRDDFNRGVGKVRLLFLVDPICPQCLRGMADIDRDLLSKLPQSAALEVYVVHEPVIGGTAKDIPAAAGLLHTALARHYWSAPPGEFGRQASAAFGLRRGNRPVYAWDIWTGYQPTAIWNAAAPPLPWLLMHQLPALTGNPEFPRLDSRAFAKAAQQLLAQSARQDE